MSHNYLGTDEVLKKLHIARTQLQNLRNSRLFPEPIQLGGSKCLWPEKEIEVIMAARREGFSKQETQILVAEIEKIRKGAVARALNELDG